MLIQLLTIGAAFLIFTQCERVLFKVWKATATRKPVRRVSRATIQEIKQGV